MSNIEKITVNLPVPMIKEFRDTARESGESLTDIIKRKLSIGLHLDKEISAGKEILIRDPETGNTEKIVIL